MIDASFTLVPIQRNTHVESAKIKEGETPAEWQEDAATAKLRQKDVDARWTKKHTQESLRLQESHLRRCRLEAHSRVRHDASERS